jgi:hypothetical protein
MCIEIGEEEMLHGQDLFAESFSLFASDCMVV